MIRAALLVLALSLPALAEDRVIKVTAKKYEYSPLTIELKLGEPVVFELTAEDIFMGFNIPDFKVRSDVVPGKTMRLALTPDRAGTFTFLCDVFCGEGHETMSGRLAVV